MAEVSEDSAHCCWVGWLACVKVDYARFHQTVPVSEGVVSRDSAKRQAAAAASASHDNDDNDDDTSTTTGDDDRPRCEQREHHDVKKVQIKISKTLKT